MDKYRYKGYVDGFPGYLPVIFGCTTKSTRCDEYNFVSPGETIDSSGEKIPFINENFSSLSKKVARACGKIAIECRISAFLGRKVAAACKKVASLGRKVAAACKKVASLSKKVASLGRKVACTSKKVAPLGNKVASFGKKVACTSKKVASLGIKVAAVCKKVASRSRKVAYLGRNSASTGEKVASIGGNFTSLGAKTTSADIGVCSSDALFRFIKPCNRFSGIFNNYLALIPGFQVSNYNMILEFSQINLAAMLR